MNPKSNQFEDLANKIRQAGGVLSKSPSLLGKSAPSKAPDQGHTPDIGRVHIAVRGGHISEEEGMDLNPKYNPERKKYNTTQASKIRAFERDPEGVRAKRNEYSKKMYKKEKQNAEKGVNKNGQD